MAKLCTSFFLALVLILASLASGPGAGCAIAGLGGSCGGAVEEGASPSAGWSGIAVARGVSESAVSVGKGERLTAADLDAATAATGDGFFSSPAAPLASAPGATSTPSYLRHCAFLC